MKGIICTCCNFFLLLVATTVIQMQIFPSYCHIFLFTYFKSQQLQILFQEMNLHMFTFPYEYFSLTQIHNMYSNIRICLPFRRNRVGVGYYMYFGILFNHFVLHLLMPRGGLHYSNCFWFHVRFLRAQSVVCSCDLVEY